jgi:dephospho-CoA kinase
MSGAGKSTVVGVLRERGYPAYDADDGFTEPRADGRWAERRSGRSRPANGILR